MSAAQHTPGPWHRNVRAQGKYPTVFSGRNQHVAKAVQQQDPAETEANIDLIAAAPELLAALRRVQPHLEGQRDRYAKLGLDAAFEDYENLIQAARAAIAKAEGRS